MDLKSLFDDLVPEEQPPSEVDMGAAMRAGRGQRRRRRALAILTPVAAAAVTALVLASGTLAGPGRRDPAATVTPSPVPSASPSKPRPSAEVWPAAVTTIPAKSADGSTYAPVTALSAAELLLRVHKPATDKLVRLEVYDTVQRTARVLGEVPEPGGSRPAGRGRTRAHRLVGRERP
ncbi:hypothetical protein [Nonomuraea sp. SYSU D8015]|uniref:hypothetical protein n=1 Tax=Nonomuraea sp. SYSU D8015 TaxID=2593644 RepID=UPI0016612167|nr:hypothetical protein [Nonomuraea sp. SYSU D8015]